MFWFTSSCIDEVLQGEIDVELAPQSSQEDIWEARIPENHYKLVGKMRHLTFRAIWNVCTYIYIIPINITYIYTDIYSYILYIYPI
jgi:hypothetical protein